jgi:ABC-2 type transport system permease protein
VDRFWLIARHEYGQHIRQRGFIIATLGMPLILVGIFAILILLIVGAQRVKAVGYVDYARVLAGQPATVSVTGDGANSGNASGADRDVAVPITRYPDEPAARQALETEQIDAYFVVPVDYKTTGKITGYALNAVSPMAQDRFSTLLRRALLASIPGNDPRLAAPITTLTTLAPDGRPSNAAAAVLLPFIYGLLFYMVNVMAGSYLLMSLVEEKENRAIEVLITSVRPGIFMGGKIVGLGLLGLTQLAVWVATIILAIAIGGPYLSFLSGISVPWETLLLMLALFVPSYLLYAASLCAAGAAVTAKKEAGQITNVFSLLSALPVWFFVSILQQPDGPLAVGLSFFPYTAPVTLLMRQSAGPIPAWQIALALGILVVAALGMVWVAGRMLRYGMLRYGRRVGLRELGRALRGA